MNTRPVTRPTTTDSARQAHRPGPRWWAHIPSGHRLRCPRGHQLPRTVRVSESAYVRCCHTPPGQHAQCGCWLFAFAIRGGGVVVAAVDHEELAALEALATPAEVIEYLDIWPG